MGLFENFPYTNFHEINLDQIIKIMRQMQDEWQQVETDWDSMRDFINNYFDNLDVSEEVLQALQTMAGDGELNTIIDPVIVAETASWLAEHITPTSPAVDNTLSIAGAAADAKATGDAVADLKEDLKNGLDVSLSRLNNAYVGLDGAINPGGASDKTIQIKLKPNTLYTFECSDNNRFRLSLSEYDFTGETITGSMVIDDNSRHECTFYSHNYVYAYVFLSNEGLDCAISCFLPINETSLSNAVNIANTNWTQGYLSGDSSTYNPSPNFMYSDPIYIDRKCTIKIFASGYSTILNILSKTNAKGGYYKEVIRSTDSSSKWYEAEITETGYYILCSAVRVVPFVLLVDDGNNLPNSNILSMYNKLICCGDSLTYGLVYTSASTYRQALVPYNVALEKMSGVPSVRYATAGFTSKDWWNANNSHLNEDGLYIIFLGTNGGLTDTINTDCVGNDPSQYADTQTGYYGRICRTLQINNKTAVLIKPPACNAETQGTIQKFADRFGFAAISLPPDLDSNYYHYAPHHTSYSNATHYNDYGYVRIANCIINAINNLPMRELFLIPPYEV